MVCVFPNGKYTSVLLLTLLLGNTGCSQFLPESPTPPVALPATFSVSGDIAFDQQWWRTLNDPALSALITSALSNNFSIKAAQARLQQAYVTANIDRAALFPTLSGSLNSNASREQNRYQPDIRTEQDSTLGLNASWQLDIWGKNHFAVQSATFSALSETERWQLSAQNTAAAIARLWYQLIEQQASLAILSLQLGNTETIAEISAHRYRTGQGSISAVWRQEQLLENLRAQHQQALKNRDIINRQLNVLAGQPPTMRTYQPQSAFPALPHLPDAGIPAQRLQYRADVKNLWYQFEAKRYDVASATAARLPSITLNAGAESAEWHNDFELWKVDLGVRLNMPLFNAGKLRNQQRKAEFAAQEAFFNYTQGVLFALQDVETSYLRELSQQEQLASLQKQTQQAQKTLNVESIRYSRGMQGYLDVLSAQEKLFSLQRQTLTAQRQLYLRRIDTYQSLGGHVLSNNIENHVEKHITNNKAMDAALPLPSPEQQG